MKFIPALAKDLETHLLIGSSQSPKFGSAEFKMTHNFNTAFLFSPDGRFKGKYQKIYLLPFGEYLPYENILPWPRGFRRLIDETGAVIPGKDYTLLELDRVPFGALICWENIFSDFFRQFVKRGARFMVNLTNEAWFGDTAAPTQFLAMNVFRATENRVSIVRSANTGISCFIDPYGRIMGKVEKGGRDVFVEGYLTMGIPLSKGTTFYTRYGDIFVYVTIIIAFSLIVVSLFRLKMSKLPE
jgi:apolipoprotein N-acyltransferase